MKKQRLIIPVLLIIVGILFGCTQKTTDADVEADIAAIKQVLDRYLLAVNTNDMDLFMTCWTDDARRLEADWNIIVGKEKIKERFKPFFDHLNMDIAFYSEIEVEVADDLGFSIGNVIVESVPLEGGPTSLLDFKVTTIFKRQADGSWKMYIDHTSPNPVWSNDSTSQELLDKQDLSDPAL